MDDASQYSCWIKKLESQLRQENYLVEFTVYQPVKSLSDRDLPPKFGWYTSPVPIQALLKKISENDDNFSTSI